MSYGVAEKFSFFSFIKKDKDTFIFLFQLVPHIPFVKQYILNHVLYRLEKMALLRRHLFHLEHFQVEAQMFANFFVCMFCYYTELKTTCRFVSTRRTYTKI